MWCFILAGLLLVVPGLGAPPSPNHRIIGGDDATITDYPYAVQIEYYYLVCGGVLVAADWVLTGGTCLHDKDLDVFVIRIGATERGLGGETFSIADVVYHPEFDWDRNHYNAILIRLNAPVSAPNTEIVQMVEAGSEIPVGAIMTVLGWGWVNEDYLEYDENFADSLQVLEVPILDEETCIAMDSEFIVITDNMFCAGYAVGGKGICYGDIGGPAMYDGRLIGLSAWTHNCGRPRRPGVFTKLSAIRSWIDETISM